METIFKYIVYQTTNKINHKIYIGVHQTAKPLDFDGYIGCGVNIYNSSTYKYPKTHFQKAVKKYGIDAFERSTLKIFNSLEDALDLERWLVDKAFLNRPDTYNMVLGGKDFNELNKIGVFIYDAKGDFIKECASRTEASLYIYGNTSNIGNITRAINNGYFINKKFQVSNYKVDFMKDYITYNNTKFLNTVVKFKNKSGLESHFGNPRKVYQYDLNNNFIKEYKSIGECKKAGFTNVQAVLEGKRTKCKGFTFKYYKD